MKLYNSIEEEWRTTKEVIDMERKYSRKLAGIFRFLNSGKSLKFSFFDKDDNLIKVFGRLRVLVYTKGALSIELHGGSKIKMVRPKKGKEVKIAFRIAIPIKKIRWIKSPFKEEKVRFLLEKKLPKVEQVLALAGR